MHRLSISIESRAGKRPCVASMSVNAGPESNSVSDRQQQNDGAVRNPPSTAYCGLCAAVDAQLIFLRVANPAMIHQTNRVPQYNMALQRAAANQWSRSTHERTPGGTRPLDGRDFIGNLKNKLVHHVVFDCKDTARIAIFDCIEVYCNRECNHQSPARQADAPRKQRCITWLPCPETRAVKTAQPPLPALRNIRGCSGNGALAYSALIPVLWITFSHLMYSVLRNSAKTSGFEAIISAPCLSR